MKMKRIVALMITIILIVGMMPLTAFAEEAQEDSAIESFDNDGEKTADITEDETTDQVGLTSTISASSNTENIVGEAIANTINASLESQGSGNDQSELNDEYPKDEHHDREYYGDSLRVRDLEDGNYLVYRDTYLIISQEESAAYSVNYSNDMRTARVSPVISETDLAGKAGVVFLDQSLDQDRILVFDGDPHHEEDGFTVPLAAKEDVSIFRLFSDGRLKFHGECHDEDANGKPSFDWETDLSGTNWSGKITDERVNDVDFVCDVDLWGADISFGINLDLSIDFDITTTGASDGIETSKAVSINIPVGALFNADVIYYVRAQFEEEPIQVKGTLQTNFDYTFSVLAGGEIHKYRNPVTISELKVLNSEDLNKAINFYLGSQITSRFAVIEYSVSIFGWEIKIGPVLSLDANWYGGCFILARHEKDQYADKPDTTKDEIHICAKNGEDGCLSLNKEERYGFKVDITINFKPIAGPWEWDLYSDDQFVERTYNYNSYTLKTGMQQGNCPHKAYRIDVKVDTNLETTTEGASVTYTPVEEEFKPFASAVVDDANGAVLFAMADKKIDVKAELTSPHDSSWKISETETLEMTPGEQFLQIMLDIPEKHIYFKNPASGTAKDWPKDFTFAPFMSDTVTVPDNIPELSGYQFVGWNTAEDGTGTDYQPGDAFIQDDDLTLWAQWKEAGDSWYVIYNANGGKNAPKPQIVQEGTDAVLTQDIPEAGTLTFKGWTTKQGSAAVEYQPGNTLPYDASKTVVVLYALWELDPVERPIHVTYDANGLEGASVPSGIWMEKTGWYQLKYAVAPLGGSYSFKGWSKKPGTQDPEYLPNHSYYFDRDTTLYAIWGDVTRTLTFADTQSGDAKDMPEPITVVPSISPNVRIPDQIPQKSGRVFMNWNTKEDGSGTAYAPGTLITLNEDITLWAQWKEAGSSWYIIYNAHGGTKAPGPQIVSEGKDAVLTTELPEAGTMIFKGWTPDPKTLNPIYQPGETLPYDSTKTNVVLYALWNLSPAARPIHITFEANGAEKAKLPEDVWIERNSCLKLGYAIAPLGGSYTFLGWSEDPGSSEPQYTAGECYCFDEDTALFAIWKDLDTKTLTFMDQYPYTATGMPQPITVNPSMSQTVKIPDRVPKKPGRFFTGWNTEKDGSGKSYRSGSEIKLTSSMHLWAQWDLEAISLLEAHVTVLIDPYPFTPDPENPKKKPEPPIRVMLNGEEVPAQYYDAVYEKSRSEAKPWRVKVVGKGEYTDESYWSYFGISDDAETFTYELVPDQTYTGKALKPHVNVYFAGMPLTEKKDYTITYKNNVNAYREKVNNATFIIKGKGNYSGTEEGSFSILPRNILDEGVSISQIDSIVYNTNKPKVYKPVPKLTYNRKTLKKDRDFTVKYYTDEMCTKEIEEPKDIGRYYVKIEGIGNYTETAYSQFDIFDPALKPVSKLTVGRISDQPYTGETINVNDLNLLVKDGSKALVMGEDYKAETWSVSAGKGELIITGIEGKGYTGRRTVPYNVIGIPMNKVTVTGLPKTLIYNGSPQKSELTLSYKKNSASEAETISYTTREKYNRMTPDKQKKIGCIVSYGENTKVGTGTVTLTGVNKCSGTVKKTFKIAKYDISPEKDTENALTITLSQSEYPYSKLGVKPKPVVKFYKTVLEENKDYTISYANNKKLNDLNTDVKPTVIIKGKGNFKGKDATTFFKIVKANMGTEGISVVAGDVLYKDKAGNWKTKVTAVDKDGKKLAAGTDYDKDILFKLKPEGDITIGEDVKLDPGTTVYVIVKAKEGSDYSGSVTGSYRIVNNDIGKLSASIEPKEFTGEEIKLKKSDITWKQGGKTVVLSEEDFDIIESTYRNNIKKGKATVVVRGKGEWGCTQTISFKIGSRGFKWWENHRLN